MTKKKSHIIRFEDVREQIVDIRGQQVILDFAVAELYGVETREINQAVKNNPQKFPTGWVFELDKEESSVLRSKILMLDNERGRGKYSKHNFRAFTERGLYMLATIRKVNKLWPPPSPSLIPSLNSMNFNAPSHRWPRTLMSTNRRPSCRKAEKSWMTSSATASPRTKQKLLLS